ncbi:hypothetical protein PsYK624_169610 [Phanerochaete sordida]|uniref:Uncharacterized protein n=1 Tax=Phanerochaete sordida TaxID=48140 RepID=A0A9P3GU61_9APHY|nr:hypothetical protein PsYK624_169610 [Phanerochaete sordida]
MSSPSVFVLGSPDAFEICISPNTKLAPNFPKDKSFRTPFAARTTRWAQDERFYTMFVPEKGHYDSTLLGPLAAWASPIVEYFDDRSSERKTYGLSDDVVNAWRTLEECLHHCDHALRSWGRTTFPSDIIYPHSPSSYQYFRRSNERHEVQAAVNFARAAFLPLAALVSFQICLLDSQTPPFEQSFDEHGDGRGSWNSQSWRCRLPQLGLMHPTVVDLLSSSWVGDPLWSEQRVGALVDFTSHKPLKWLERYPSIVSIAGSRLPIWFFYGVHPERCSGNTFAQQIYAPLQSEVNKQIARAVLRFGKRCDLSAYSSGHWGSPSPGLSPDLLDIDVPTPGAPEPEPGSRQHSGEDIWEFLKRDADYASQKMMDESDGARQRRLYREQAELGKTYPTLKGPRVYHWVRTQGYWTRRRVEPMKYRALWDDTQPDHRRYNSVTNEWDVSLLLGPGDLDSSYQGWDAEVFLSSSSLTLEGEFGDDEHAANIGLEVAHCRSRSRSNTPGVRDRIRSRSPRPVQHGSHATSLRSTRPGRDVTERIVDLSASVLLREDIYSDITAPTQELLPALAARYGFRPTITSPFCSVIDLHLKKALRILVELPHDMASTPRMRSIPDFVTALSNSASNETALTPCDPPCDFWDLTPGSIHHDGLRSAVGTIALRVVDAEGETLYFIAYAASASWCLAVMTAIDAVEIARRRWGPKAEDIVHELVARGISFRILWPLGAAPSPARPAPTLRPIGGWVGLGYRDATYKPVGMDYQLYIDRRRAIINGPRAAAALAKGGIVWRLVYEELEPGESLLERHYSDQNTVLRVGENSYETCAISDEELNCICGVYRIYADSTNSAASESSWWPKYSTWKNSGMDVGYWTKMNEEWFVHRREQLQAAIREGSNEALTLRTATDWRRKLRYESKSQTAFLRVVEGSSRLLFDA